MTATTITADLLPAATTQVQAELNRVDTKAGMLLLGSLTSVSAGVALIAKASLPGPAIAAGLAVVTLIAGAVALLISAVRPALRGNHGFIRWAAAPTASALLADLSITDRELAAYHAHTLLTLSRCVRRKFRLVRAATDLLRIALVLAVLTAVLAVTA